MGQWKLLVQWSDQRPSCCSCPHWGWHQWPGGDAGGPVQRLLLRAVPLPAAPAPGPRAVVLHPHVQVPQVLLLQEFCLHLGALLVWLLLWLLSTGRSGFGFIRDVEMVRGWQLCCENRLRVEGCVSWQMRKFQGDLRAPFSTWKC